MILPNPYTNSEAGPANGRKYLVGILVLALVMRVAAMLVLHTWIFPSEREFGYETGEIGYAIANGQGFSWPQTWRPVGPGGQEVMRDHPVPTTWEAPIYPMIIGAAFWSFGSYTAAAAIALELLQILMSVLGCYVLFCLGKQLFNEQTGLLAAFFFALYPLAIHFSVQKAEYPTLLVLLSLLLILRTIQLSIRPGTAGSAALGVLSGVATLVNPVILAFYPFAMVWFVKSCSSDWRNRLKYAVVIVGCCAATMTPWLIRNYLVFDQFVFLRPNFTRELVRSNFFKESVVEDKNPIVGNDGKMSSFFNQQAERLILRNPGRFLRSTANKVINFWTGLNFNSLRFRLVLGAAYYPILVLGMVGAWAARRQQQAQLPIVFLLTMPLPFYLTWVFSRYRFPVEPILILFASYVVTSLVSRLVPSFRLGRVMTHST